MRATKIGLNLIGWERRKNVHHRQYSFAFGTVLPSANVSCSSKRVMVDFLWKNLRNQDYNQQ